MQFCAAKAAPKWAKKRIVRGPAGNRTRIWGFRVPSDSRYTTGPPLTMQGFTTYAHIQPARDETLEKKQTMEQKEKNIKTQKKQTKNQRSKNVANLSFDLRTFGL